jgi:endonuclease/exonuclease/phosphatase (EEP) superfamily protein YafD
MSETVTTLEPGGTPGEPRAGPRPAWATAARVAWIGCWAVVALLAWIALSRLLSITFPARVTVLLQAVLPLAFLPAYPIAVIALVRRHWLLGAACLVLVVVHVFSVYPALGSRPLPAWATNAPRLTVLEANMYDQNPHPDTAARKVMASGADVLVLVELNSLTLRALRAAGVDQQYPYSTLPAGRYGENVIWSKRPLSDVRNPGFRQKDMPSATVDVDGRPLFLVAVHVDNAIRDRAEWTSQLHELGQQAAAASGAAALVGDFNATRWNPPFGDLLGDGLHDAHESVGKGLSRSWPIVGYVPLPLMRLDHALVNDRVAVASVSDYTIPGSDHRGFVATLAVNG